MTHEDKIAKSLLDVARRFGRAEVEREIANLRRQLRSANRRTALAQEARDEWKETAIRYQKSMASLGKENRELRRMQAHGRKACQ
jgi:hypothetical protein